jgi:hypothetical protein
MYRTGDEDFQNNGWLLIGLENGMISTFILHFDLQLGIADTFDNTVLLFLGTETETGALND